MWECCGGDCKLTSGNYSMNMSLCQNCQNQLSYNERYDAHFCEKCNEWKEKNCSDSKCFYCISRPQKPMNLEK